ncbi:GAF domain-containing protein [Patescibacteria group bacterium]|nr:GAF domain-containing protein [Patescibacteria group bacterium]
MTFFAFTTILTSLVSLVFAFLTYFRNRESLLNKTWAGVSIAVFLWSFSLFNVITASSSKVALFWQYFLDIGGIFVPVLFTHFSLALVGHNKESYPKHRRLVFIFYISGVLLSLLSLTSFFKLGVAPQLSFNFWVVSGQYYFIFPLYFLTLVAFSDYLLFKALNHSSRLKRGQIKYVLIASFFGFIGSSTNFLPQLIKIYPFGSYFVIFYVVFVAYAISRYRLMDIRIIIARTITFGLLVAILTSIYGILSALIGFSFESFYAREANPIFVGAVVAVLIAIGYQPLRSFVARITDRFLFKKAYDADELLGKISEVTSSITNIKTLLEHIAQTLNEAFHFEKLAIVLLNEEKKLVIAHKEGFNPGVAEALINYPKVIEILYKEIQQVPGLMVLDEMKTQYENGEFKPASPELLVALLENDLAVVAPLYVNKQLIGVMAIGNKKSGDSYTQQDLSTLRIIAGQSAVGIENARLYNQLKGFNVKLEAEVTKKTAELQKANDELRQLDRAKSEFISIASHQLRTPLTVIKGYISMMQEGSFGKVPPKILENLTKVYASNERLIGLVENLLDISRIESGRQQYEWSKIHLEDLAQTVVDNLKQNAKERNLKLILHKLKKKTPEVIVDANKLHEVMMNFVDNALKYTPEGSVDVHVLPEPKGMVTFSVKDTGKGITPDMKDLLFRKFSRGKDSFKLHTEGVGLGLYVAKMLIDQHGGKIWADSDGEGKGSTFSFTIPIKGNESKLAEQEKLKAATPAVPAKTT